MRQKGDKWERKMYIEQCKGDIAKDIIKISLHMWKRIKRKR